MSSRDFASLKGTFLGTCLGRYIDSQYISPRHSGESERLG